MSFLLDTNVVSELRKRPGVVDPGVLGWAQRHLARDLYISVVTVLEIELGVARIERRDQQQGAVLRDWMRSGVLAGFAGRILPVDVDVAVRAAHLHRDRVTDLLGNAEQRHRRIGQAEKGISYPIVAHVSAPVPGQPPQIGGPHRRRRTCQLICPTQHAAHDRGD